MRKLFSILSIALLSTTLISCSDDKEFDDLGFTNAYPGLLLIDHAAATNAHAMDGISVAMRFAILYGEMTEKGLYFDEDGKLCNSDDEVQEGWSAIGTYTFANFGNKEINKKQILFSLNGDGGEISRLERGSNKFTITYGKDDGTHTQGALDNVLRRGTYVINTRDKKLTETTGPTDCWEVTLLNSSKNEMTFATSASKPLLPNIVVEESDNEDKYLAYIYMNGEGKLEYVVNDFTGRYNQYENKAEWDMQGEISIPGLSAGQDLTFANTVSAEISYMVDSAYGVSLDQTRLKYGTQTPETSNHYANTPLKFVASKTALQPCGGGEFVEKLDKESAESQDLVTRKFFSDGTYLVNYKEFIFPNNIDPNKE